MQLINSLRKIFQIGADSLKRHARRIFILFMLATINLNTVHADHDEIGELLKILQENKTISQEQYEKLKPVEVKTDGGITVSTFDKRFAFDLGGRLLIDTAFYDEDKNPLGNGTELRFARLELKGTLFKDWLFRFDPDFATGSVSVKEASVSYFGLEPLVITVGHTKEPFGLENNTNTKNSTLMERALNHAFIAGRKIGVRAQVFGQNWTAGTGLFGESFDTDVEEEGDEGWGTSVRLTYVPIRSKTRLLHFGVATSYREPGEAKQVRFRARPESHITSMRYVDTGKISQVDNYKRYGLEAVGVLNAFSLQGEYIRTDINSEGDFSEVTLDGWYVLGSWFLTGESRPYKFKKGGFTRVKPKSKRGAWEMAARYNVLNFNDGLFTGGQEKNIAFGINWYISKQMRVMANYIMVDNDQYANANGSAIGNDDPNIFQMRFQVDF